MHWTKDLLKFKGSGVKGMRYLSNCTSPHLTTAWVLQLSGIHWWIFVLAQLLSPCDSSKQNTKKETFSGSENHCHLCQVITELLVKWILSFFILGIKFKYSCF